MFVGRTCSEMSFGEPHGDINGSDIRVWFKVRCKVRLCGLNNIIISTNILPLVASATCRSISYLCNV